MGPHNRNWNRFCESENTPDLWQYFRMRTRTLADTPDGEDRYDEESGPEGDGGTIITGDGGVPHKVTRKLESD